VAGRRLDGERRRWRWFALALGSALLLLGVGIGSWIASGTRTTTVTVTAGGAAGPARPSLPPARAVPKPSAPTDYAQTPMGAVAAASAYVSALAGPALLEPARVRAIVRAIAAESVRDRLAAAYSEAATLARQQLGLGTIPAPIVIASASGPTPPLSPSAAPSTPGELFAAIPQFKEFSRVDP
jgi:hypothetical protein